MLNQLSQTYGITGHALKWMESYLSDRYQTVVVDGEKSDPMELSCGLPQGATLATKGFNLYICFKKGWEILFRNIICPK